MDASRMFTHVQPSYRTFWRRAAAGLFDWCLIVEVPSWIGKACGPGSPGLHVVWSLCVATLVMGYSIVGHKVWGQTVGKWLFGVRVVGVDGGGLAWWQAIARDCVPNAMALAEFILSIHAFLGGAPDPVDESVALRLFFVVGDVGWYALEMATMFLNEKRRAVHDLLARTVVIRTAPLGRATRLDELQTPV